MDKGTAVPSAVESRHIAAMSRPTVVHAYKEWRDLSDAEEVCLKRFVDEDSRLLDLGCGTGRMVTALKPKPARYLGVDRSAPMIEAARLLHDGYKFIEDDFLSVEIPCASTDVVMLMNNVLDMLHPATRRLDALRLAQRALSPGGVVICSSHLTDADQSSGYHAEDYHGERVMCYRSSFARFVTEVEQVGLDVLLALRDFRGGVGDWLYLVAQV